jgi:hypothetical protein
MTNKTLAVGTEVVVNFHQSGIAGNATIAAVREHETIGVFYDIAVTVLTEDPANDPKELRDIGYKLMLKDIPSVFVLEVIYDPTLMNSSQVASEAEDAIQEAVVVSEDDAILDAMKSLVIEHETNKAETETMKVNRDVDAE